MMQSASTASRDRRPPPSITTEKRTADGVPGSLTIELRPVDELAVRYYKHAWEGGGSMHPLERMRLLHDGAIMGGVIAPMPDDELAFDAIRARMGVSREAGLMRNRSVLDCWYATGGSSLQKSKRLHISRSALYNYWRCALAYVRGRLNEQGILI
jgi:hypothetical protein